MAEETKALETEQQKIDAFLARPLLARLATADPVTAQPHVVPVWFGWDGEKIYISAFSSTRKVKELCKNQRCAIVIDVDEALELRGVLLEGQVELVTEPRKWMEEKTEWVYTRYLGPEGVKAADPQSWIVDPENTLVVMKPEKIRTWA
jgi:nitroimidazol reductase NimA-like FMN-containing flavoprotein (pyridoxamine 5'-phosphate oxidase superfamily)